MAVKRNMNTNAKSGFAGLLKLAKSASLEKAKKTAAESKLSEVPEGSYVAQLTKCEERSSNTSGKKMLMWTFKIVDGEFTGKSVFKFSMLEGDDMDAQLGYLLGDIARFGIDVAQLNPEEIPEAVKSIVADKPFVKLQVKRSTNDPTRMNVYVNGVLEGFEGEDGAEEADETEADESEAEVNETEAEESGDEVEADAEESDDSDDADSSDDSDEAEDSDEPEEAEIEVGSAVDFKVNGSFAAGVVTAINEKKKTADVKVGKTIHKDIKLSALTLIVEDEAEDEDGSEDVEIDVGMRVEWGSGKAKKQGTIAKVDEKAGTVTVKPDGRGSTAVVLTGEDVTVID
jgi:hypothetical protein